MIGYLNGLLHKVISGTVIIDVAGVGYEVEVNDRLLQQLPLPGNKITIYTYHHIREDTQLLFGFASIEEKNIFMMLLKVNGVGPRLALAIVSCLQPNQLINAIVKEDVATLTQVKGLGAKVAKRLVMDLKSSCAAYAISDNEVQQDDCSKVNWQDAILVLTRLGYKNTQAEKVVMAVRNEANDLDHLIRLSLKYISKETSGTL